jgi:hypothetical protein
MPAAPPFQRVALAGLRALTGADAEGLLALLAEHGEAALRPEAAAALAARSKAGPRG